MSDDPTYEFFAAGAAKPSDVPATSSDPTYDFLSSGEVPKGIQKPPPPKSPEPDTWLQAAKNVGDAGLTLGSGALKGIHHAVNDLLPGEEGRAEIKSKIEDVNPILNYQPHTQGGQDIVDTVGHIFSPVSAGLKLVHQGIANVAGERTADVVGDVATLLGTKGGREAASGVKTVAAAPFKAVGKFVDKYAPVGRAGPTVAPLTAEEVLAKNAAASQGNMGAAEAAPSLEGVSPELKGAIAKASNHNREALQRHIDADTLPLPEGEAPLRLRHGQATRDDQQISDEKNLRGDPDTQGILSQSITDQNKKLGMSMGEIRRRANPDIVQLSSADHGQTAVDAIKDLDNATVLDTRAKYKALEDAAGGSMPIDTGKTIEQIRDRLKQKLLTKTAADEPAISEVMDTLSSGQPMSFETFNSALSNLAEVQRARGSPAAAATVVRNALESMPLTEDGAKLKGLRDIAAAAAKKRFDTIEQNPAYEAAVNDNVPKAPNGLHRIGAPSPLADSFMDRYALGNGQTASRAYVERLKQVMQQNQDFSPAIEASALNKMRDSAKLDEFDEGQFAHANFRNTHKAMSNKADVLMSPSTVQHVEHLRRVSDDVGHEGKASTINRSNTALTLQRYGAQYPETPGIKGTLADYGADLIAAHVGPVGYAAKKIGSKLLKDSKDAKAIKATQEAKLKFARDATAPGAGIHTPTSSTIITRATGGKVDHEALLGRLVQRYKTAKKMNDAGTETLLKTPDASIIRALDIAGRSLTL
jgi:hypothetical protein